MEFKWWAIAVFLASSTWAAPISKLHPATSLEPPFLAQKTPFGDLASEGLFDGGERIASIQIEGSSAGAVRYWNGSWWATVQRGAGSGIQTQLWKSGDLDAWSLIHEGKGRSRGSRSLHADPNRLLYVTTRSVAWIDREGHVTEGMIPGGVLDSLDRIESAALGEDAVVVVCRFTDFRDSRWSFLRLPFAGSPGSVAAPEYPSNIVWFKDRFVVISNGVIRASQDGTVWSQVRTLSEDSGSWDLSSGGDTILIGESRGAVWSGESLDALGSHRLPFSAEGYRFFFDGESHRAERTIPEGLALVLDLADVDAPRLRRFTGGHEITSVARWGGLSFLALANDGYIYSKGDSEWFLGTLPGMSSIHFSPGRDFISAVGTRQSADNAYEGVWLRSTDAREWNEIVLPGISQPKEVIQAGGFWWIRGSRNQLWRSEDGETFERVEVLATIAVMTDLEEAFDRIILIGIDDQGKSVAASSANGEEWDGHVFAELAGSPLMRLAGGENEVFAYSGSDSVEEDPAGLWRSSDGVQWSKIESIELDFSWFLVGDRHYVGTVPARSPPSFSFFLAEDLNEATLLNGGQGRDVSGLIPMEHGYLAVGREGLHWLMEYAHYWRSVSFGASWQNDAASHDDADPDGDGFNNVLERALAMDPLVASVPEIRVSIDEEGILHPSMRVSTRDTEYLSIESSNDLKNWKPHGLPLLQQFGYRPDSITTSLEPGEEPLFLRFKVADPEPSAF